MVSIALKFLHLTTNSQTDEFSRRIARNIQVMLQTESNCCQPVDPVGGSWYVETLAAELCEKIWAEFQTIEPKVASLLH